MIPDSCHKCPYRLYQAVGQCSHYIEGNICTLRLGSGVIDDWLENPEYNLADTLESFFSSDTFADEIDKVQQLINKKHRKE